MAPITRTRARADGGSETPPPRQTPARETPLAKCARRLRRRENKALCTSALRLLAARRAGMRARESHSIARIVSSSLLKSEQMERRCREYSAKYAAARKDLRKLLLETKRAVVDQCKRAADETAARMAADLCPVIDKQHKQAMTYIEKLTRQRDSALTQLDDLAAQRNLLHDALQVSVDTITSLRQELIGYRASRATTPTHA